jgi:hypothetical protein
MTTHAKRIAVVIDTLARPQGGVARITVQGVVVVLATSIALCTGRLSLRNAGREEALLPAAQTVEVAGQRVPS